MADYGSLQAANEHSEYWGYTLPLDIPLRNGGLVRLHGRGEANVFWQIFVHGCYRLCADCRTTVDAGANIGMFSVWAARQLPPSRILAVEPFPETFGRLQHNPQTNCLGSRVEAVQFALATQSGERLMPVATEWLRCNLMAAGPGTAYEKTVKVQSTTIAELIHRYELRTDLFAENGYQGSEWEVLHSTPVSVLHGIRRMGYHHVHAR